MMMFPRNISHHQTPQYRVDVIPVELGWKISPHQGPGGGGETDTDTGLSSVHYSSGGLIAKLETALNPVNGSRPEFLGQLERNKKNGRNKLERRTMSEGECSPPMFRSQQYNK